MAVFLRAGNDGTPAFSPMLPAAGTGDPVDKVAIVKKLKHDGSIQRIAEESLQ